MALTHMKMITSLIIREIQNRIMPIYNSPPIRLAKIQILNMLRKQALSYIASRKAKPLKGTWQ